MIPSQDTHEVDKCNQPHGWMEHIGARGWTCGGALDKEQRAQRVGQTSGSNHSTPPGTKAFGHERNPHHVADVYSSESVD